MREGRGGLVVGKLGFGEEHLDVWRSEWVVRDRCGSGQSGLGGRGVVWGGRCEGRLKLVGC